MHKHDGRLTRKDLWIIIRDDASVGMRVSCTYAGQDARTKVTDFGFEAEFDTLEQLATGCNSAGVDHTFWPESDTNEGVVVQQVAIICFEENEAFGLLVSMKPVEGKGWQVCEVTVYKAGSVKKLKLKLDEIGVGAKKTDE